MIGTWRVLEHHLMVYRRTWKGGMFVSFASPILFLAAMGIGLGSLIARGPVRTVGGVSYLAFLAPGLYVSVSDGDIDLSPPGMMVTFAALLGLSPSGRVGI